MTSPAQLQYLKAIGIPVWVSRELILDNAIPDVIEDDELPCTDSVQSVLEELETQTASQHKRDSARPTATKVELSTIQPDSNAIRNQYPNQIATTTNHRVFATGSLQADWMVIGQSPDINESAINQPYPHDIGELLSNMLRAVGVDNPRMQAYMVNILSLPEQLDKQSAELAKADLNKKLLETIKSIQPKMILIVGQLAAQTLLKTSEPLARIRSLQYQGSTVTLAETQIPVVVTYYPSYLLSKPQDKRKTWDDLKLAMGILSSDL